MHKLHKNTVGCSYTYLHTYSSNNLTDVINNCFSTSITWMSFIWWIILMIYLKWSIFINQIILIFLGLLELFFSWSQIMKPVSSMCLRARKRLLFIFAWDLQVFLSGQMEESRTVGPVVGRLISLLSESKKRTFLRALYNSQPEDIRPLDRRNRESGFVFFFMISNHETGAVIGSPAGCPWRVHV